MLSAQESKTFQFNDTVFAPGQVKTVRTIVYYDGRFYNDTATTWNTLDSITDFLLKNEHLTVEIGVHTDYRGSDKYNLMLSKRRAEAIKSYVVDKGVKTTQVIPVGYGETQPLIPAHEIIEMDNQEKREIAHKKNRRTEIKVIAVK